MAVDKLVDSAQLDADLTSVADAIRLKSGGSSPLSFPAGFISEIANIPAGGAGLKLLANGEYTKVSTAAAITIPVSYTGIPHYALIVAKSLTPDTGMTVAALKCFAPLDNTFASYIPAAGFAFHLGQRASDNALIPQAPSMNAANAGSWAISETALTFGRIYPSYPWIQTDYKWFIYGE